MLHKNIRNLVEKYTFITHTTAYAGVIKLYYKNDDGVERFKKLPFRATKDQLIRTIDSIKQEINWYDKRIQLHDTLYKNKAEKDILINYIGEI